MPPERLKGGRLRNKSVAHRRPYLKTNCWGSFEVANNSLSAAKLYFRRPGQPVIELRTDGGTVLEMVGD